MVVSVDVEICEVWENKVTPAVRSGRGLAGGALDGVHGHGLCFQALDYEDAHVFFSESGVCEAAEVRRRSGAERWGALLHECGATWIEDDLIQNSEEWRCCGNAAAAAGGSVRYVDVQRRRWMGCFMSWEYGGGLKQRNVWTSGGSVAAAEHAGGAGVAEAAASRQL